jgi:hypothetical protein
VFSRSDQARCSGGPYHIYEQVLAGYERTILSAPWGAAGALGTFQSQVDPVITVDPSFAGATTIEFSPNLPTSESQCRSWERPHRWSRASFSKRAGCGGASGAEAAGTQGGCQPGVRSPSIECSPTAARRRSCAVIFEALAPESCLRMAVVSPEGSIASKTSRKSGGSEVALYVRASSVVASEC